MLGLAPFAEEDERAMRQAGIKVVGSALDEDTHPGTFSAPQTEIGRLQVEHLAERGHRVLAYAAPSDARLTAFADRRLAGVVLECERLGLPGPEGRTRSTSTRRPPRRAPSGAGARVTSP